MRRYTNYYYHSRAKLRNYILTKLAGQHGNDPYELASFVQAPIVRLHVRRQYSIIDVYRLFTVLAEVTMLARESVRAYIVSELQSPWLEDELRNIDRSVLARFQQLYGNDLLLAIVVGEHVEGRKLTPLRGTGIDGTEAGVDLILKPARTVRWIVSNIKYTKFYYVRRL